MTEHGPNSITPPILCRHSNMKSNIKFVGRVLVHLGDELIHDIDNLVVDTGKWFGVSRLFSNTEFGPMSHIAIGTSPNVPTNGDVGLNAEIARQPLNGAAERNANVATVKATFPAGVGTGTIREAGLFNAAAGGMMFSHVKFGDVPKTAADPLSITWIITAP